MARLLFWFWALLGVLRAEEDFYVIPLGQECLISYALREFNIKKASYPYEWCITPFTGLYDSLRNNFADFTEPSYFTRYVDNRSPVNKYGICLAHDFGLAPDGVDAQGKERFMLDPNWRNDLPKVQTRYQRRVDRFRNACLSGKKVVFIRHLAIERGQAEGLAELIHALYPALDFILVCVREGEAAAGEIWDIPRVKHYVINRDKHPYADWELVFKDLKILPSSK